MRNNVKLKLKLNKETTDMVEIMDDDDQLFAVGHTDLFWLKEGSWLFDRLRDGETVEVMLIDENEVVKGYPEANFGDLIT